MFYTRDQFEHVPAKDLLKDKGRWLSAGGNSHTTYTANRIDGAYRLENGLISISYIMTDGIVRIDERSKVYEINFLEDPPYVDIARIFKPDDLVFVLKKKFNPKGRQK